MYFSLTWSFTQHPFFKSLKKSKEKIVDPKKENFDVFNPLCNFFVCFGMRPFAAKKKGENGPVCVKKQVSKFTKIPTAMMVFTTWRGFFENVSSLFSYETFFLFFGVKGSTNKKREEKLFFFQFGMPHFYFDLFLVFWRGRCAATQKIIT